MNTIKFNASMFIVPNSLSKVKNFFNPEKYKKIMTEICELNGTTFDPKNDLIVQTWYNSKQLGSENLARHGAYKRTEDGNTYIIDFYAQEYFPVKIFKDHKEGDVINFKIPCKLTKRYTCDDDNEAFSTEETIEAIADMQLELNQLDYRYRNHGTFEEVLDKLISRYHD